MSKKTIRYATKSVFKKEEINGLLGALLPALPGKKPHAVGNLFEIEFADVTLEEPLERDINEMVRHKAKSAYRKMLLPCVVEHAGLILERYKADNYPGGLTQPMWDALGPEDFVRSVQWAGARAIARAIVGYCDGTRVHTFVGETWGMLVSPPRGARAFYWDTVFCPDGGGGKTYAEIASSPAGLLEKIELSQSTKAMFALFDYLIDEPQTMFADY